MVQEKKKKKEEPKAQQHECDSSETTDDSHDDDDDDACQPSHADEQHKKQQEGALPKPLQKPPRAFYVFLHLIRLLFWDVPLALVFGLYLSTLLLDHVQIHYLRPQMELLKWTPQRQVEETTYYHRFCEENDLTATTVEELVIPPNQDLDESVHQMVKHGVAVFPDLLPDQMSDQLRNFVLEGNKREEGFWVIEGEHRFSFGIGAHMDPVVMDALEYIGNHPQFAPFIEKLAGKNPSIIEFTAITNMYGAKDQFWHADVLPKGSHLKTARSMIPSYSLFVALQNTTSKMGATQVCPGSHVCAEEPTYCAKQAFQVSGSTDNWQKGTAFLFNQAFYHRGMGHFDPNGPDRTTFIITFAPRPQFRPGELETRQLSQGGSYSQRWDQWGHVLDDMKHAHTRMVQPWKTLKALGIYKFPKSDWGWDMVTVASMRIINDDNGYHEWNLEEWMEGGGFKFLPKFLHGSTEPSDDEEAASPPFLDDPLWYTFLVETLHKCQDFIIQVNGVALATYLIGAILFDLVRICSRWKATKKARLSFGRFAVLRSLRRVLVTHGLVAYLAYLILVRVDTSQWAHQIKSGLLYQVPLHQPHNSNNNMPAAVGPGTLPNAFDVLIPTRYNSDYLASYNDVIHVTHPGNVEWKLLVEENAVDYDTLPHSLQYVVAKGIVHAVKEQHGRFLIQGYGNFAKWIVMQDKYALEQTRRELLMASNTAIHAINAKLEHLLSETKFGVWQRTALHQKWIPKLLRDIQDSILKTRRRAAPKTTTPKVTSTRGASLLLLPRTTAVVARLLPKRRNSSSIRGSHWIGLPPVSPIQPPFVEAWMKEGDIVEAMYQSEFPEWYKGTLVHATPWDGTLDVVYDDGEKDNRLCGPTCVRPFVPFQLNEVVEARMMDPHDNVEDWERATVAKVYPEDGTYDVVSEEDNRYKQRLTTMDMRRFNEVKDLDQGQHVEARYQGEDEWFPGVIVRVNPDDTYDIEYDDGDFEEGVDRRDIR